jgi:hypothetical protein
MWSGLDIDIAIGSSQIHYATPMIPSLLSPSLTLYGSGPPQSDAGPIVAANSNRGSDSGDAQRETM